MSDADLLLVVGDEEFLAARAVAEAVAAVRAQEPGCDVREMPAGSIEPGELAELLSPSLFGERRVLVVRQAQDANAALSAALSAYLKDPTPGITLVVVHSGGGRGKALLTALREAGARSVQCKRLSRADERVEFVRAEVARAGGTITPQAAAALLDAVGADLRELAAACSQLTFDSGGQIGADAVARYHRGRAEVTGFAVADRAVVGDVTGALQTLRWALTVGVAHVLIADALADAVRTVARVASAGRSDPYTLAGTLGLPPWKVKRAQGQARGWSEAGLRAALGVVATANADVKGAVADPSHALEQAIRRLAVARGSSRRR